LTPLAIYWGCSSNNNDNDNNNKRGENNNNRRQTNESKPQPMDVSSNNDSNKVTIPPILEQLRKTYTGTLAVDCMHIGDVIKMNWIRQRIGNPRKKAHIHLLTYYCIVVLVLYRCFIIFHGLSPFY
jgi:hypothetical protein